MAVRHTVQGKILLRNQSISVYFFVCSMTSGRVSTDTVFQEIRSGVGFETGDFVKEMLGRLPCRTTLKLYRSTRPKLPIIQESFYGGSPTPPTFFNEIAGFETSSRRRNLPKNDAPCPPTSSFDRPSYANKKIDYDFFFHNSILPRVEQP